MLKVRACGGGCCLLGVNGFLCPQPLQGSAGAAALLIMAACEMRCCSCCTCACPPAFAHLVLPLPRRCRQVIRTIISKTEGFSSADVFQGLQQLTQLRGKVRGRPAAELAPSSCCRELSAASTFGAPPSCFLWHALLCPLNTRLSWWLRCCFRSAALSWRRLMCWWCPPQPTTIRYRRSRWGGGAADSRAYCCGRGPCIQLLFTGMLTASSSRMHPAHAAQGCRRICERAARRLCSPRMPALTAAVCWSLLCRPRRRCPSIPRSLSTRTPTWAGALVAGLGH